MLMPLVTFGVIVNCFNTMDETENMEKHARCPLSLTNLIASIRFELFVIRVLNKDGDIADMWSYCVVVVNHRDGCLLCSHLQEGLETKREKKTVKVSDINTPWEVTIWSLIRPSIPFINICSVSQDIWLCDKKKGKNKKRNAYPNVQNSPHYSPHLNDPQHTTKLAADISRATRMSEY